MFKRSTMFGPTFQPGPHDVICAKSQKAHQHVGNRRFRLMLELHIHAYEVAKTKRAKKELLSSVFTAIQACGGRFIRQSKDGQNWESLGSVQVREKIGHGLRHALVASSRATTASRCLYDVIGEKPKIVSLQRSTSSEDIVDALKQTSGHSPHHDPIQPMQVQSQCTDPLPMNCTTCFETNPRSSLVNMLLSLSSLPNSLNDPQEIPSLDRRCSSAVISILLGSMQTSSNEREATSFSLGGKDILEQVEDDLRVPYETLFLDDACALDTGRFMFSDDAQSGDDGCLFETMVDKVLAIP